MTLSSKNVSAIMPVRNGAEFLTNVIQNIEANMEKTDEIIVINDGSEDCTKSMISQWQKRDHRVRLINTDGIGIVSSLNLGLREASNNLIARFDVDDSYSVNRIRRQREEFDSDTGAIFTDYSFFSSKRKFLGIIPTGVFHSPTVVSLFNSQRTPHPSVMFRKDICLSVGGYKSEDFPAEDLSLWIRMSNESKLRGISENLLSYRLSENSITGRNKSIVRAAKHRVLAKNRINYETINDCLETWKEIFLMYELSTNYAFERKLFMLYDLVSISTQFEYGSNRKRLNEIRNYLMKNPLLIPKSLNLSYYKLLRKFARV